MSPITIGHADLLRSVDADEKVVLTGKEFNYLLAHPEAAKLLTPLQRKEFDALLAHEVRSSRARRAVATKKQKYAKWPSPGSRARREFSSEDYLSIANALEGAQCADTVALPRLIRMLREAASCA